jgi:NTP pyrophosphatase (non-canonical NTP hydrolase)
MNSNYLITLISLVLTWARERNLFENPCAKTQALKTVSEMGEFADNIAKGRDCRDDIGDILVTLIIQCEIQGTTLEECLDIAYDEIKNRKGKTVNGVFIKEGDVHGTVH